MMSWRIGVDGQYEVGRENQIEILRDRTNPLVAQLTSVCQLLLCLAVMPTRRTAYVVPGCLLLQYFVLSKAALETNTSLSTVCIACKVFLRLVYAGLTLMCWAAARSQLNALLHVVASRILNLGSIRLDNFFFVFLFSRLISVQCDSTAWALMPLRLCRLLDYATEITLTCSLLVLTGLLVHTQYSAPSTEYSV